MKPRCKSALPMLVALILGAMPAVAQELGYPMQRGAMPEGLRQLERGDLTIGRPEGVKIPGEGDASGLVRRLEGFDGDTDALGEGLRREGFDIDAMQKRHGFRVDFQGERQNFAFEPRSPLGIVNPFFPDGMTNGDPPNPGTAPKLQELLLHRIIGSGLSGAANTAKSEASCANYSQDSKDYCFLPVVSLVRTVKGVQEAVCSGTIIAEHAILTAAHCACEGTGAIVMGTGVMPLSMALTKPEITKKPLYGLAYQPGKTKLLIARTASLNALKLASVQWPHDDDFRLIADQGSFCKRKQTEMAGADDLAILYVKGVTFPSQFHAKVVAPPATGSVVNMSGFGPDKLLKTSKTRIKRYGSSTIVQQDDMELRLVAREGLRDTCSGDSGSGVYLRFQDGSLGVFGVLSSGTGDCTKGFQSRYVSLGNQKNMEFLQRNVPGLTLSQRGKLALDMDRCIGRTCKR